MTRKKPSRLLWLLMYLGLTIIVLPIVEAVIISGIKTNTSLEIIYVSSIAVLSGTALLSMKSAITLTYMRKIGLDDKRLQNITNGMLLLSLFILGTNMPSTTTTLLMLIEPVHTHVTEILYVHMLLGITVIAYIIVGIIVSMKKQV